MGESNQIIVGSKPTLNYVTACITLFNKGTIDVVLRARGKAINMAVEVAQLLKSKFVNDVSFSDILIDGETLIASNGKKISLPIIEITLSRKKTSLDNNNK